MRAVGRETGNSHEDIVLSHLYEQVTELQESRFGAEYDLEEGRERYMTWLHKHGKTPEEPGALPDVVTSAGPDAILADAFPASGTARA